MSANKLGYFLGGMVAGIGGIAFLACKDEILSWLANRCEPATISGENDEADEDEEQHADAEDNQVFALMCKWFERVRSA